MAKKLQRKKSLNRKLKQAILFLVKLNLLALPLYLIIYLNLSFAPLQNFLASLSSAIVGGFGYEVASASSVVAVRDGGTVSNFEISWDSTGWKSLYVLTILALATPTISIKKKALFLAAGLPIIFLINFFRIITTIILTVQTGSVYFDFIHTVLWRAVAIASVIGLWYVWIRKENYNIW